MSSNCGLIHMGTQDIILTEVRDELRRMEEQEGLAGHIPDHTNLRRSISKQSRRIELLIKRAENAYNQSNYNDAKSFYKSILREDPYSKIARRGLEQINSAQSDYYRAAYDQTRSRMLEEVDIAWAADGDPFGDSSGQSNFLQHGDSNPNQDYNYNGRNFIGNPNTLAQHTSGYVPPELPNAVGGGNDPSGNGTFPITPASPIVLFYETLKNTNTVSQMLSIPAEGKEILLTHEQIYGDLKLHIFGIDNTTALGWHQEDLDTNLKELTSTPRADLVGIPFMQNKSIPLNKGNNKLTLTLPNNIKPSKLNITTSLSNVQFLETIISSPLISRFSSDAPFHEPHPAGQLMAVCSYLDYLIVHKLDEPAQKKFRTSASRLCADLTLSQKTNGSWSQIRNRKASSLMHTALSYQALMMAKRLNIPYEKTTSDRALKWITAQQKSLATKLYSSRAIVQLALASSGDADFTTCNRLYRERSKMDNIGRALLANVFVLLDKNEFTSTLVKELNNDITVKHPSESYLSSSLLLDALRLNAEVATNKKVNVKFTHHFNSDIERGLSAYAYSKSLHKIQPLDKEPALTFSINGKQMKNGIITADSLKIGENIISIDSTQPGAIVSAELIGRQIAKAQHPITNFTVEDRKYYRETLSYKGLPLKSRGSSPVTKTAIGDTIQVHLKGKISNSNHPDSILIEEIPAGFSYLSGSLKGNHSGARHEGNHLVITYGSLPNIFNLRYTLIAEHPGSWTHNPSVLSASNDPSKSSNNTATKLTVLAKGAKDNTPYQMNQSEHYELAQLHFKAKEYAEGKKHILAYRKLKQTSEDPVLAQMLLWIETDSPQPDAQLLADSFEILTERNPDLVIPFDKILKVGKAYRQLGEFERGMDVYTATLDAGFSADSYVGAALEDQGKFMLSIDYQNKLWLLYPDLGEVSNSRFALAQQIYSKAATARTLGKNPATKKLFTKKELIELSLQHTKDFLTHTPEHELADDAAFSIANALFALKLYKDVVKHTAKAIITHKDSEHATSFRYMQALGNFWLRNYDQALKSASDVAKGKSEDKDLAAFITAQIYHAKGLPELAIKWYKGIEKTYPDAKESIAYFEQKSIKLDEVKILNSGEKFSFKLKYRNIKEAQFQVYRVDLMKLYLREKNLSNISKINLAGITPKHTLTTQLGNGNDYQEREKVIELPVKNDGAYLVICRGDYLHTSGLVLITPLKLEVQEYPHQRSVRVNISDKKTGKYIDSVHVKAIGLSESKFKTGETDLRGVWQTENISSPSTIIAKDPKGRYAFFRSKIKAGSGNNRDRLNNQSEQRLQEKIDFKGNLNRKQDALNNSKLQEYEKKRRSKGKGVEIKKARKK